MSFVNTSTTVAVCCYAGDAERVDTFLQCYLHHDCPVVIFSPRDSSVHIAGPRIKNVQFGRRAYIGQDSLDRQRFYMKYLAENTNSDFFLINDSDSFCLSPTIPRALYMDSDVLWSNEVTEPRPHESPYPKLAFQPPYFLCRNALKKMIDASVKVSAHPITPYVDWWMNAVCHEAGLRHRAFGELEHHCDYVFHGSTDDPEITAWQGLDYRIRYRGAVMMHPMKTKEHLELCLNARSFYEYDMRLKEPLRIP